MRLVSIATVTATTIVLTLASAGVSQAGHMSVAPSARVSFRTFSLDVPRGWYWRRTPGFDGSGGGEFSNRSLAGRHGFSPEALLSPGAFMLWINPLGEYGSPTRPTFRPGDFIRFTSPACPRGQARADHSYCSRTGRCFSITLQYGGNRIPEAALASINSVLVSLRAAPSPRR
jgi:hypothetical protein